MIFKTNVNKHSKPCAMLIVCDLTTNQLGKERYKKSRYLLPLIENKRGLVEVGVNASGDLWIFDANFLFSSHHAFETWRIEGLGHFLCEPIVVGFYWRDCNY